MHVTGNAASHRSAWDWQQQKSLSQGPNQNRINEEVLDRPGGVHGPVPERRHQVLEDSSSDEELEDFREVITAMGEIRRTPTTSE
jgi:hypothetical protein